MAVGEKEELEHFEGGAEQGGGEKGAEGEAPPAVASYEWLVAGRSRSRSSQATVGSLQFEEVEDKSAYARSGYGVTGIKYQEEQSG